MIIYLIINLVLSRYKNEINFSQNLKWYLYNGLSIFIVIDNILMIRPKKIAIPKKLKELVWKTYVGQNILQTPCLICNDTQITAFNFHCAHVLADSKGGEPILENLRPVCGPCNGSMGTTHMREFILKYFPNAPALKTLPSPFDDSNNLAKHADQKFFEYKNSKPVLTNSEQIRISNIGQTRNPKKEIVEPMIKKYSIPKYQCARCLKNFSTSQRLTTHLERKFPCQLVNIKVKNLKNFICQHCKACFTQKSSLNRHQKDRCSILKNNIKPNINLEKKVTLLEKQLVEFQEKHEIEQQKQTIDKKIDDIMREIKEKPSTQITNNITNQIIVCVE